MPLQRRLPKRGFKSQRSSTTPKSRWPTCERLGAAEVDLLALKQAGLVGEMIKNVKVIKSRRADQQGRQADGHRRDRRCQGCDRSRRRLASPERRH